MADIKLGLGLKLFLRLFDSLQGDAAATVALLKEVTALVSQLQPLALASTSTSQLQDQTVLPVLVKACESLLNDPEHLTPADKSAVLTAYCNLAVKAGSCAGLVRSVQYLLDATTGSDATACTFDAADLCGDLDQTAPAKLNSCKQCGRPLQVDDSCVPVLLSDASVLTHFRLRELRRCFRSSDARQAVWLARYQHYRLQSSSCCTW